MAEDKDPQQPETGGDTAEVPFEEADKLGEAPPPDPASGRDPVVMIREMNMRTPGQLVLHYPSRDVTLYLDGEAAMRLLTMFHRRTDRHFGDVINPGCSASAGWVVLDLHEPMAMSWSPIALTNRTAVDPLVR